MMSSTVLKQIETLIAHLRDKDPNMRYKALKKLAGALAREKYAGYHNLILEAISNISTKDRNKKIRIRANEYVNTFGGDRVEEDIKGHIRRIVGLTVAGFLALTILILIISMFMPEEKVKEVKSIPQVTSEPSEKPVVDLGMKVKKGYGDYLKVEIKNTVKFKGKKLFTNVMKFKLQRKVTKIMKDGSLVIKQWVTEAFGVAGNLHEFGYPNLGEKLYAKYTPLGKVELIKTKQNEDLPKLTTLKFSKYIFPKPRMTAGDAWRRGYKYSFQTRYKLDGFAYLQKKKLIRVLFDSVPSEEYVKRMKSENYADGVMYLDVDTRMLLHSVRTLTFKSKPEQFGARGFNLSSKMVITETSSKLDNIKLEGLLHEKIENVIDNIGGFGNKAKEPRGVTD